MAVILGIDPGSRVTGYGLINAFGNRNEYIASGCIRTTGHDELPARLHEIFTGIQAIIERYQPVEVAIEKIFMARSAESALKLGHARGVALVAAVNNELPIFEYEARKVKQAVVGSGAANKSQVQHMVKTLLNLPADPQQDAADALAICLCHVNTQHNLVKMAGAKGFRRGRLNWNTPS